MSGQDLKNFNTIRMAGVVRESIVDGPGLRFAVFCQGCPHGCKDCHNQATHDFRGGYDCEISKILEAVEANPLLDGVTFSGGEPFCQAEALCVLGERIRALGKSIVVYSGYTYEQLIQKGESEPSVLRLLDLADLLIDGPYIEAQRDLSLQFRGSKNQRVIDLRGRSHAAKA